MSTRSGDVLPRAIRPEVRLLLYLARSHRDHELAAPIADLLHQTIDWDFLIDTAGNHGTFPLLYRNLKLHEWECVSRDVRERLRRLFLANAARNHRLTFELLNVLDVLNGHGIPAIPFKGPILAVAAYGDVALRQFEDLDILIHREDAVRAKEALAARGYVSPYGLSPGLETTVMRYQKHFLLVSPVTKTTVELHWTVEPVTNCRRFCDEHIWEHPGSVTVEGTSVPNLAPEDALVLLCLHGSSHCWDRLGWICDVAEHVAQTPIMHWELAVEQARDLGCRRMLYLGLAVAGRLVGLPLPEEIAAAALRYSGVEALTERIVDRLLFGPYEPTGTGAALSFRLATRESMEDKVRFVLERFVIPDALDCAFWRLPENLSFFFFVLRPVRLLLQSFGKGRTAL